MSTTGAAVTLTAIGTAAIIPAPSFGTDFANVQIQNSSVFVISVLAGGETFTIQSFTAQTVPLAGDAVSIIITPIANPLGENASIASSLIPVWLLENEKPPMQDGPLTAAALAAAIGSQGIGSLIFTAANPLVNQVIPLPANTRTVIAEFITPFADAEVPNFVSITGAINYYAQPPYLIGPQGNQCVMVAEISGPTSSTVAIQWTWPGGTLPLGGFTLNVYADTAQYPESVFYNGPLKVANLFATTGTLLTGPCRIFSVSQLIAAGAAVCNAELAIGSANLSVLDGNPGTGQVLQDRVNFPEAVILQLGQTLTFSFGGSATFGNASAAYAYP